MMLTDDLCGLLLLEDRMEFLHQRYHDSALKVYTASQVPAQMLRIVKRQKGKDEAEKLINFIISLDPDPGKKNSQWLLAVVFRKNHPMPLEDLQTATLVLTHYAQAKQARTLPRERYDINSFKSLSDMATLLRGENEQLVTPDAAEQAAMLKEAKVVYDAPDVMVLIPLTKKAACYFGRNTGWCTAWGDHKKLGLLHQGRNPTQTNMYASYAAQGPLFIIELKASGTMLQYHSEANQFMDSNDRVVPDATVKSLLKAHPGIMRAIGEDRFIKTHLHLLGINAFSTQALLRVRPDLLLRGVNTAEDYDALPPAVRAQPEITAAILIHKPEIKLPPELFTPQAAAALRDATANLHLRANQLDGKSLRALNAFNHFPMNEWSPQIIQTGITTGKVSREQLVAASELGEPAFTAAGYHASNIKTGDNGSLYLLISGDDGSRWSSGWIEVQGDSVAEFALPALNHEGLIEVLNALGKSPTSTAEVKLAAQVIYCNNIKYGLLTDVGKPDIQVGDTTLFRLGSRLVWIAQIGDRPTTLRLWLQGKTLYNNSEVSFNSHEHANLMAAVRQLALKYRVRQAIHAGLFGMLNTKAGLVADFATFIARAKQMPDIAYFTGGSDGQNMIHMAITAFPNRLSPDEQQTLYAVLRGTEARVETKETDRIYDLTVPHMTLVLPVANSLMATKDVITDRKLRAKIIADSVQAMKSAAKLLAPHQYANTTVGYRMPAFGKSDTATAAKLEAQIEQTRLATRDAINERHRNPDKYATDLSGRFGALNALRKRDY